MKCNLVQYSWVLLCAFLIIDKSTGAQTRNVTHEDIRDAMLSLIHMFRSFEDKLERHEYREKALGEQLKMNLASIEKRQRALEPLKGALSRLDERLSNVETIIMQREDKDRKTQQKTTDSLDEIKKSISKLFKAQGSSPDGALATGPETSPKLDAIKQEVAAIRDTFKKEALHATCLGLSLPKHMQETEKLLTKYELKLTEFNSSGGPVQTDFVPLSDVSMSDEAWHSKMTEVMEKQEMEIRKIHKVLADAEGFWKGLPNRDDVGLITNLTVDAINNAQYNILGEVGKESNKVLEKLHVMNERSISTQADVQKSLTEGNVMTEKMYRDVSKSYDQLKNEVQALGKVEKVMIQTADNVLDTKKRVEYGVHQILVEVGELIKQQGVSINHTIVSRFDDIGYSIAANQTGAMTNLSSKIEEEMSHVWTQIGTMYRQITASKQTLDRLQQQTEQYVNGSVNTMDSMESKVGLITNRMSEVDENLNYLLGRLSVVTQQFNQIRTGLGDTLDKVNESFAAVQNKIKEKPVDKGPGPHEIKDQSNDIVV